MILLKILPYLLSLFVSSYQVTMKSKFFLILDENTLGHYFMRKGYGAQRLVNGVRLF